MYRLILPFVIFSSISGLPHRDRIVGGQDANEGQFPFMASLNSRTGNQWCDGVIIDTQWILTTASCVQIVYTSDFIWVGSYIRVEDKGEKLSIFDVYPHEEYNNSTFENNIALVKLIDEITYNTNIQPIEIGDVGENVICTMMGWGGTENDWVPDVLQYAEEMTTDVETCKSQPNSGNYYLEENIICGSSDSGSGTCTGDGGGPLVCNGLLAGLTSFSFAECENVPNVFTRVALYKDWINAKIAGE